MSRADVRAALAGVRPTLADRVVSWFDPVSGARRLQARYAMVLAGGYTGARRDRRATSEWSTTRGSSADADLLPDLADLRDRSRDLVRNNPLAGGAICTVVTNVVGTGLALQAQIDAQALGMTDAEAAAWQKTAEREFALWCKTCDLTRTQDFYELQDLVFRSALESGDCFALTPSVARRGEPYAVRLQIVEADRVANPLGKRDSDTIAGGVEMDVHGAPVAYHVLEKHPGAFNPGTRKTMPVPAFGATTGRRNVIHLFKRLRPGQTRGEPYLAPVIEPLKQLGTYTDAEIMAAVVSGMFTVFTYTEGAQGLDPSAPAGLSTETGAKASDKDVKLGNGAIVDLGLNEKVEVANPGRPNQTFDPFVQAVLRQIGVRLELPFEVLVKHYTASYSAARAAILEAWRFFKTRRAWLAGKFCQPVYEIFLEEAVALGRIAAPGFFDDAAVRLAYCGAAWHGDGMGAIDPMKEIDAAEKRMSLGVTTLAAETAEYNGGDWEQNTKQRGKEVAARREAGLEQQPVAAAATPDEPNPDDNAERGDLETPPNKRDLYT